MRTLVERDGREVDLPHGHTIDLFRGDPITYVLLYCLGAGGSIFVVREIERRADEVVVHLGDEIGRSGPAAFGDMLVEPGGYPFPD